MSLHAASGVDVEKDDAISDELQKKTDGVSVDDVRVTLGPSPTHLQVHWPPEKDETERNDENPLDEEDNARVVRNDSDESQEMPDSRPRRSKWGRFSMGFGRASLHYGFFMVPIDRKTGRWRYDRRTLCIYGSVYLVVVSLVVLGILTGIFYSIIDAVLGLEEEEPGDNATNATQVGGQQQNSSQTQIVIRSNCIPNPCGTNEFCVDIVSNYTCVCQPGFTSSVNFENITTCTAIFPCDNAPCATNQTCNDRSGTSECVCSADFQGVDNCNHTNRCLTQRTCHSQAICVNSPTSFQCSCPRFYTGNATFCEENVNPCIKENGVLVEKDCFKSWFGQQYDTSSGNSHCLTSNFERLAYIKNEDYFDKIVHYLRYQLRYVVYDHIWEGTKWFPVGHTFDLQTNKTYFRGGEEAKWASDDFWYPGYPKNVSGNTAVFLAIGQDVVRNHPTAIIRRPQGFQNLDPHFSGYPLCQRSFWREDD